MPLESTIQTEYLIDGESALKTLLHDRYHLNQKIGEGGSAKVYLAFDLVLRKNVALKILSRQADKKKFRVSLQRFKREVELALKFDSKHLVSILDIFTTENQRQVIVMEYVDGITLKHYINSQHHLAPREALAIIYQIIQGTAAIHKHNVIHRDLKPQNILIAADGLVKITDFGISFLLNQHSNTITENGNIVGSMQYIPPEYVIDTKNLDFKTDIYSIGIILYEMLTGHVPFNSPNANFVEIFKKHIEKQIPAIPLEDVYLNKTINYLIYRATFKNPQNRYQNIDELKLAVETILANKPLLLTPIHARNKIFTPRNIQDKMNHYLKQQRKQTPTLHATYNRRRLIIFGVAILSVILFLVVFVLIFKYGI